ncbi:MAG: hypothetical protein J0L73_02525 [Verrucomicrobia bacterium]|nr:hypothetical protein [Verrucomicrobiota bacterium]
MKLHIIAILALISAALSSCLNHLPNTSPAYYNPNCYANIYEHSGFRGEVVQLQGPATYSTLKGLKGRDWDNTIGSVQTGPGCWIVLYKDKDFKDVSKVIGPNTSASDLGEMNDQAESIRVLDRP